jgi:hypothetical protein
MTGTGSTEICQAAREEKCGFVMDAHIHAECWKRSAHWILHSLECRLSSSGGRTKQPREPCRCAKCIASRGQGRRQRRRKFVMRIREAFGRLGAGRECCPRNYQVLAVGVSRGECPDALSMFLARPRSSPARRFASLAICSALGCCRPAAVHRGVQGGVGRREHGLRNAWQKGK